MNIGVAGIPDEVPEADAAIFRSRVIMAFKDMMKSITQGDPVISVGTANAINLLNRIQENAREKTNSEKETPVYAAQRPSYTFEQLILPETIKDEITLAIQVLKVESLVFDTWGLRAIEPNPKTALNFYGPPGTGKTLAAHAIADYLEKKILVASYAEIESKYHGDGPKNVKALFQVAEKEGAVLFIDEADSLLSKRLTNVTQGSEQAINSMRSQLLINLELFHGVVIFSTNLVQNYDKAFETRVRHIQFPMPDEHARRAIWEKHLPVSLPTSADVLPVRLAMEIEDVCGRDIKNAVIQAAVEAALRETVVSHQMLSRNIQRIKEARIPVGISTNAKPLSDKEKRELEEKIKQSLHQSDTTVEIS